jgi:hypothetical protein
MPLYDIDNLDYGMDIAEDTSQGIAFNPYLSEQTASGMVPVYTDENNPFYHTYVNPAVNIYGNPAFDYSEEVNINEVNPFGDTDIPMHALLSRYQYGGAAAQMFKPYDTFGEDMSRKTLSNDIQNSLSDIEMIAANSMKSSNTLSSAMGKAGFAGSGLALTSQDYIEQKHSTSVSQEHSGIRGSILSHMIDVRKKRQGYVDELWGSFNDYLATDPTPVELSIMVPQAEEDLIDESLPGGGDDDGAGLPGCWPNC